MHIIRTYLPIVYNKAIHEKYTVRTELTNSIFMLPTQRNNYNISNKNLLKRFPYNITVISLVCSKNWCTAVMFRPNSYCIS